MNTSTAYTIAYGSIVIAASLGATLMTGSAMAEGPIFVEPSPPFASARSRDDVRAEVMAARGAISSAGIEWALQQDPMQPGASGRTRGQSAAEYIAARDEVRARNGEDSGSAYAAARRDGMQPTQMMGGSGRQ